MVGTLGDLVSIYKWPTTIIAAANITVNRAFASWWTSFISPHRYRTRFSVRRTPFRLTWFRLPLNSMCIPPVLVLKERAKQQRNLPMMISFGGGNEQA